MKKLTALLFVLSLVFGFSGIAGAYSSMADSFAYLTGFTITPLDPNDTWVAVSSIDSSKADADNSLGQFGNDTSNGPSSVNGGAPYFVTLQDTSSQANSNLLSVSTSTVFGDAIASSDSTVTMGHALAEATTAWKFKFKVDGINPNSFTLKLDYSIDHILKTTASGDTAYAKSKVTFNAVGGGNDASATHGKISNLVFGDPNISTSDADTLSFIISFNKAGTYNVDVDYTVWNEAKATSSGVVPEPATMLLLGSGLIGLAGFGRKKLAGKKG